jgi:hypothetical protein
MAATEEIVEEIIRLKINKAIFLPKKETLPLKKII